MLIVPTGATWGWRYHNGGTNPSATPGTSVTPGINNGEGTWTAIASAANIAFEGTGNYQSNNYTASSGGSSIFTNYASHNYTLLSTSPAKDYGVASYQSKSAPTTDYLGSTRPAGSGYDAGAYEYGSAQAPTCSDGILNGDETGVDCGGSCPACGGGSYTGKLKAGNGRLKVGTGKIR